MNKKPVSIKIVYKGDEKFMERVFVNGKKELVYAPPKVQTRRPRRPQLRVGITTHAVLSRGAAIAFYTVTSIASVLLIVIAIAGLAFGREALGPLGEPIERVDAVPNASDFPLSPNKARAVSYAAIPKAGHSALRGPPFGSLGS